MKRLLFLFVALSGCYAHGSLDNVAPIYTGPIERPPMEVAECLRAGQILTNNAPLEIIRDGDTIQVIFVHNQIGLHYLLWKAIITENQIAVFKHSLLYDINPSLDLVKDCSGAHS